MRALTLAVLVFPLAAGAQPSQAIRLEMRLSRPQIALGSSIPMTIRVVPVSTAARDVLARRGFEPVRLLVTRGGRSLPDLAASPLTTDLDGLRKLRSRPALGGAIELDTDLAYWATLDRAGRYDVVIEFAPSSTVAPGAIAADASFPPARSSGMPLTVSARPAPELAKVATDLAKRLAGQKGIARTETIRALGATRSPAALQPLVDELYAEDESARWAPAALGLQPDRAATVQAVRAALAGRGISGPVAEVLLSAGDPPEGLAAAARTAVAGQEASGRRRAAAALAVLARAADGEAKRALVEMLLPLATDRDAAVRSSAVYGLEASTDPRALSALATAGRDASATVRSAAIRALRLRRAVRELLALLGGQGTDPIEVAQALAAIPDEAARRALVAGIGARGLPMRLACARALWEVGDRSGKGILLLALRSRDDTLRAQVIDWLTVVSGRSEPRASIQDLAVAWTRWLQQMP